MHTELFPLMTMTPPLPLTTFQAISDSVMNAFTSRQSREVVEEDGQAREVVDEEGMSRELVDDDGRSRQVVNEEPRTGRESE